MKQCNTCKRKKELNLMVKTSRNKDGYRALCKSCKRKNNKKLYNESSEIREYVRNWRSSNKDAVSLYNRNYREKIISRKRSF